MKSSKSKHQQFEHLKVAEDCEIDLNLLGENGWQLVTIIPGTRDSFTKFYFKRPILNERKGKNQPTTNEN